MPHCGKCSSTESESRHWVLCYRSRMQLYGVELYVKKITNIKYVRIWKEMITELENSEDNHEKNVVL
jgi:hypothetical protein